jgi:hypothetical protein
VVGLNGGKQTTVPCYICDELLPIKRKGIIAHTHFQWHADEWFIRQEYKRTEIFRYFKKVNPSYIQLPDSLEFVREHLGSLSWRNPDLQYKKDKEVVLGDVIVWDSHPEMLKKVYIMHQIFAQIANDLKKRVVIYEPFEWREKAAPTPERDYNWYKKRGLPCANFRGIAYEIQNRVHAMKDLRFEILELNRTYSTESRHQTCLEPQTDRG